MTDTFDVIIIGAGVIGNATAYYLARRGLKVAVLEKSDHIGGGASARNGGGVRQSGRHPAELPLAMYGVKNLWPNLSAELDLDVEYYRAGNLRLGKTGAHLDILAQLVQSAEAGGLDMRLIGAVEARGICPGLAEEVIGAGWCPSDGHANPLLVTLGYYRAARRLGARFISGAEVVELRKIRGRVAEVVTAEGEIRSAGRVVVAAGYESRKILSSVGLDVPMHPLQVECLVTEEAPPMFCQMLGTAMADFYGHQSRHGSFVFGGSHGYEAHAFYGQPLGTSIAASSVCRAIIGYLPALREIKIVRVWAGWLDECADHIPVIDNPAETPGLTVACGFSGHGFGIAPVVGILLAALATEETPVLDLSAFRYDRFRAQV
ncbi:MAG: FAD-binding oxidoreductase [Gracilibacteraceae bacterium]|jgi:sarcosine oxidase subunit beta|nr:FAD-binding oxidoreductase [Gracilibacteraceae bacterium]